VKLDDLQVGGDFDVLAWLEPALVYVEIKTARPNDVSDGEMRNFLQRDAELAPDLSILLVDTADRLDPLVDRANAIMTPLVARCSGITDPDWRPDPPTLHAQPGHFGIVYGWRRIYLVNAHPSIPTVLRRCLRHYHQRVRGAAFWGGREINFVTGEISD
jgi:hypothetical protein